MYFIYHSSLCSCVSYTHPMQVLGEGGGAGGDEVSVSFSSLLCTLLIVLLPTPLENRQFVYVA